MTEPELTNAEVLAALEAEEPEIAASYAKHEAYNRVLKEMCEVSTRKHYQSINKRRHYERLPSNEAGCNRGA